jgi:CBS domain-containing protein
MTAAYARRSRPAGTLESVPVAEAMHREIVTCAPEASLSALARIMAAHRIHAVVVVPGGESEEWGLVSDLDLIAATAAGQDEPTAGDITADPAVHVTPRETVARAAQLMHEHQTHHLIVLPEAGGRPLGVISTLDVADVFAERHQDVRPRSPLPALTNAADPAG